jgi:hypothetical protein
MRGNMNLVLPRSFIDHPLSRKAKPLLLRLIVLRFPLVLAWILESTLADINDLAYVRAGSGVI